jgi:hypothetical protein
MQNSSRMLSHPRRAARLLLNITLAAGLAAAPALAQDGDRPAGDRPELPGGIDDKPYQGRLADGVEVGGYMDMEFEWVEDGGSTFDAHRFVPFITGYVSDRVTVSAEIEFEHGGKVEGGGGGDGEIKLEYAVMDFALNEALNFRGGVILSPLGSFNLLHDTPLNDLTERPTVSRQLIPTTLSEAGMGFFGTTYPGESSVLSYQAYLVNGFDEGIISGSGADAKLRVRGGRGSQKADNNEDKALAARVGLSPALGTNFGASIHTGKYDDAGEHGLTIAALDAKTTFGAIELQGEMASVSADIDRDLYPEMAESQLGAYGQVNWHVLHDKLLRGSLVTLVARGDWVDYDRDRDGDKEEGLTLGANFRPTEETVFKLDYTWTWATPAGGDTASNPVNRLFFSFATYF